MKKCKRCLVVKDEKEFYKHSQMQDGYLSFCKSCFKKKVSNYRNKNIEIIREKDKARFQRRKHNPDYIKIAKQSNKKYYEKTKIDKNLARKLRGQIPNNCSMCNIDVSEIWRLHAHHEDYSKPLQVIWVCPLCHKKLHKK